MDAGVPVERRRLPVDAEAETALLCLVASAGVDADTYPRQPEIDAIHYAFTLELTGTSPEITARPASNCDCSWSRTTAPPRTACG
jgi:hypothetical protein